MPTMPNYVGLSDGDANAARISAGFSGGSYTATISGNTHTVHTKVTSQSPAAGTTQTATVDQSIVYQQSTPPEPGMIWGS